MATVDDTNILTRSDPETLADVKAMAADFLSSYPIIDADAIKGLEKMNLEFIRRNISPGGCADLLAITLFFHHLEEGVYSIRLTL